MTMALGSKQMDHQPRISVRFNWVIPASELLVVVSLLAVAITEIGAYGRTVDMIFLDSDY